MDNKVMQKPNGAISVKNVSKGPLSLGAPGKPKIFIDAGKSHEFADDKAYVPYMTGAQGLKNVGNVEITIGEKVDKQEKSPAVDDQAKKLADAAAKSAPAPAAAAKDEEEAPAAPAPKPAAKPAAKK